MPPRDAHSGPSFLTRRGASQFLLGAAAFTVWRKPLLSALCGEAAEATGSSDLLASPIRVPGDFVGMHAHRWPAATAGSAPPAYAFGAARSHDHEGVSWNQIHLGPNHYAWENLDRWVDVHHAAGRTLIYTLYGTPAWLAQRAHEEDLYGRPGGASAPKEVSSLREFVVALMSRYNGDGRRRIQMMETWNEPHFEGRLQDFWWGSAEELVAVGRTVYTAAKSVDRSVRVLSPGFAGDLAGGLSLQMPMLLAAHRSSVFQFLTASDGNGANGMRWCDGIAFHTYNAPLAGENVGYLLGIAKLRKMLSLMNCTLPLFNTECGFIAPHPFRDLPPLQQAVALKRLGALQAAAGVQGLYFYSHDDDLIGNPAMHPEIAEAIGALQRDVAGKTLRQVSLRGDGSVRVATDAGAFTW